MKGYVEQMAASYQDMVRRRRFANEQIERLKDSDAYLNDVIDMMTFSHPDGDRVQTSGYSDKTAKIAMNYHQIAERMGDEEFLYWKEQYKELDEKIRFFEEAVKMLPAGEREVMSALVLDGLTWDQAESDLFLNRRTLSERRTAAMNDLSRIYERQESEAECYLLS